MSRRLLLAWVGLALAATAAPAQVPFSKDLLPTRPALARVGLERHWFNVIPLGGGGEQVLELSIDHDFVFAQTDRANFHVFDSESGRLLWSVNLGSSSVDARPASANSTKVFVTNGNQLLALERRTGQILWTTHLDSLPASSTAADEERVWVGLLSGTLQTFMAKDGKPSWTFLSQGELSSRPQAAGKVVAFASHDGRVYVSRTDSLQLLYRWTSGGAVTAPLGSLGERTLLVPSLDHSLYAVDLFLGSTKWNYPTGAPIEQEPLVAGGDVFVVNTEGQLASINGLSGEPNWSISTLGGPLLGVTGKRVYLESRDGDLFIVDRATGQMLFDPRTTHERAGLNIREFKLGPTNRLNDRIYIASKSGMLLCFREPGAVSPTRLRDPKAKPFGYIPPEGYPDAPVIPRAVTPGLEIGAEGAIPAPETGPKAAPAAPKSDEPK